MIKEASDAWIKAYQSHDPAAVAATYSEDGMLLPPDAEPIGGREAITTFWKGLIDTGAAVQLDNQEIKAHDDLGYRMGFYKIFASDGAVLDKGKYIEIWVRKDGKWRLHRDIWNTSLPPAEK